MTLMEMIHVSWKKGETQSPKTSKGQVKAKAAEIKAVAADRMYELFF